VDRVDEAARFLIAQGVLGLAVFAFAVWTVRKDRESTTREKEVREKCELEKARLFDSFVQEMKGRISDAQTLSTVVLGLQKEMLTYLSASKAQDEKVVEKLGDLALSLSRNTVATESLSARIDRAGRT
jgi:hypothetical protein